MKKIQYASFVCFLFLVATKSILHGAVQKYGQTNSHHSKKLFGATSYNSSFDENSHDHQPDLWPEERNSESMTGHHTSSSQAFPETPYIKIGNRLIGRTGTSKQKLEKEKEKEKEKKREKKKRNKQNQRKRARLFSKIEQDLLKVRQGNSRILRIKKEETQHALEKSMAETTPLTPPVLPDFDRFLPAMQKAVNISLYSYSIPRILDIPDLSSRENMQSLGIFINNASQDNVLQENKQANIVALAVCWATEHCLSAAFEKLKAEKISQEEKQEQEKNLLELPLSSNTATSNITIGPKKNLTTVTKKGPNSENSHNDLLNIDFPESDHESDQDTQPNSPIYQNALPAYDNQPLDDENLAEESFPGNTNPKKPEISQTQQYELTEKGKQVLAGLLHQLPAHAIPPSIDSNKKTGVKNTLITPEQTARDLLKSPNNDMKKGIIDIDYCLPPWDNRTSSPAPSLPTLPSSSLPPQLNNRCHGDMCKETASSKCAICKVVSYCSKKCQVNSWQDHKIICQSIRQEQIRTQKEAPSNYESLLKISLTPEQEKALQLDELKRIKENYKITQKKIKKNTVQATSISQKLINAIETYEKNKSIENRCLVFDLKNELLEIGHNSLDKKLQKALLAQVDELLSTSPKKLENKLPDQNNNYNQEQHSKHIAKNPTPPPTPSPEQNILEKFNIGKIAEKGAEVAVMLRLHAIKKNSTPATFLANQYFCQHCQTPNFDDPDTKKDVNYFLQQSQAHGDNNKPLFSIPELIQRWVNEKFIPAQQIKIKEQQEKEELEQKKRRQDAEEKENKSAQLVIAMQQLIAEPKNSPSHSIYFEKFRTLFYANYRLVGTDVERHLSLLNSLVRKYRLGHNAWKPERVKQSSAADRTLAKPKKNKSKHGNGNKIATSTHCRKQDISKSIQKLADTIIATRNRLKLNSKSAQSLSAEAEAKVCAEDYALFRWGLTNVPLEQPAPEPALPPEPTEEEAKNAAQALATQSYIMRHGGLTITVDPHTKKHHVFNDLRYNAGQIDERYDDGCYRIGNTTFFPSTMKEEDLLERIGRAIEENGIPFTDNKGNTIIMAKLPQNRGDSGPSVLHRIHILVVMQKKNPGTIKTYYRIHLKTYDRLCLKAQNNL